jgi:hypothetical protein
MDIVGILPVSKAVSPVSRPCDPHAVNRLVNAEVIVSYNDNHRDLLESHAARRTSGGTTNRNSRRAYRHARNLLEQGHLGQRPCVSTNLMHFKRLPPVADTYEGSNRRDVLMTYHLSGSGGSGRLKVVDGRPPGVPPP